MRTTSIMLVIIAATLSVASATMAVACDEDAARALDRPWAPVVFHKKYETSASLPVDTRFTPDAAADETEGRRVVAAFNAMEPIPALRGAYRKLFSTSHSLHAPASPLSERRSTMAPPETKPLTASPRRRLKSRAVITAGALLSFSVGAVGALSITAPKNKDVTSLAEKLTCGDCKSCFILNRGFYYDGVCNTHVNKQDRCFEELGKSGGLWCGEVECGLCGYDYDDKTGYFDRRNGACHEFRFLGQASEWIVECKWGSGN